MRKQTTDPTIWDSQWQKRRFVWTKAHTAFVVFAVIGVLCVAFVWWRLFTTGSGSAADVQVDFTNYVFDLMEEYKPRFVLYDRLTDPKSLLQEGDWKTTAADDAQSAALALLGEGCVIRSWEELKQAEADRLWQEWFYGDKEMRSDIFIITELSLHIDRKTLPGLGDNTWLAETAQRDRYVLIHADGIWGIKLLPLFQ